MNIVPKKILLSIVAAVIFADPCVMAQTNAVKAADELALFENIPIVYSASKMKEPIIRAPAAISVITAKDLKEKGIIDIPNAFRYVPGMDVTAFSGGVWGVSARGYNELWSRRMLVLIDGMGVYTPLFSGVRWGILPLLVDDINQIEIVRGPNDTLYGFNAFNGVININTKDPKDTYGFFGKYVYSDYGENQFIARYGDKVGLGNMGKVDYRIAFSNDSGEGYGDDHGKDFSDKMNLNAVTARARYMANDIFNAEFIFGIKDGLKNEGPITATGGAFKSFDSFDFEQVRLNGRFSDDNSAYLQFYRWRFGRSAKTLLANGLNSNNVEEIEYDLEFQDNFSLFDNRSETAWGATYRHNVADSLNVKANLTGLPEAQPVNDDLWATFINEKLILLKNMMYVDELAAVGGVRAEWSHLTRQTVFAPRGSLLYSPVKDNTFRATYARGYRLPSFIEEFDTQFVPTGIGSIVRVLGNQQLKSEVVDSYELGYASMLLNRKLELNADTYWSYYRDIIGANRSQVGAFFPVAQPEIIDFNNECRSRSWGLELSAIAHPISWCDLYTNYTYETIRDISIGRNDMQYQGGTSLNKLNAGISVAFKKDSIKEMPYLDGFSSSVNMAYKSGYTFFNINDSPRSEFSIKPNVRLDFRVAKSFFDEAMEVAFIGNNVAGNGNYEARWVKVPQVFYFTVTVRGWPWDIVKKKIN